MSFEGQFQGIDYYPCRYGGSRTTFRGPAVALDGPYTVVLGGSEVYGKYVEDPFTDQFAERTGRTVVNLGIPNCGPDAFVAEPGLKRIIAEAQTVVIQAMGAQNVSNRYYSVHPRRNDRFVTQSAMLANLYRDVDFTEFAFTRHMLQTLREVSPDRFNLVQLELEVAWVVRMRALLSLVRGERVLLWIEDTHGYGLGPEPLFVTVEMMQQVEGLLDKVVHCDVSPEMQSDVKEGMIFPPTEFEAAQLMLSPAAHEKVATSLVNVIKSGKTQAALCLDNARATTLNK